MLEAFLLAALALGCQEEPAQLVKASVAQQSQAVFEALRATATNVHTLSACYVQTQESLLFEEPLVSSGKMYLRTDPLTLVLRVEKPEALWIRTDCSSHQVWYRTRARAERFLYKENPIADAMLKCLSGNYEGLASTFEVLEVERASGGDLLTFAPRAESLRKQITRLELRTVWVHQRLELESIAYTNADGERTRLELHEVQANPKLNDEDPVFSADLPAEIELLTHDLRVQANHHNKQR